MEHGGRRNDCDSDIVDFVDECAVKEKVGGREADTDPTPGDSVTESDLEISVVGVLFRVEVTVVTLLLQETLTTADKDGALGDAERVSCIVTVCDATSVAEPSERDTETTSVVEPDDVC